MPRQMSRFSPRARAPLLLREMQACLTPGTYIKLLHDAALTGQMPILTSEGRPTGEFTPLDSQQRIETAKYLLNKIVPDAPRVDMDDPIDPKTVEVTDIKDMTSEELARLAALDIPTVTRALVVTSEPADA